MGSGGVGVGMGLKTPGNNSVKVQWGFLAFNT